MSLHQILLQPTDVLFFRDGRPMGGSLAGHTAGWPLPDVTNHALHAALHRADLEKQTGQKLHRHAPGRSSDPRDHSEGNRAQNGRLFGSLLTAGPFPVRAQDGGHTWFFPRPKDATLNGTVAVTLQPVNSLPGKSEEDPRSWSSLPDPLKYAVANSQPPSKDTGGEPWISSEAYRRYLTDESDELTPSDFIRDTDLADTEQAIGIGIDPATGTTGRGEAEGRIYSAHYLRLREDFRLGLFVEAMDKTNCDPANKRDLIAVLLNGPPQSIIVGGQQRLCTAERVDSPNPLPLPGGLTKAERFKPLNNGKFAVKWILLTPAIWPEIPSGTSRRGTERRFHPGGWMPNWICPQTGSVLLQTVDEAERRRRRRLNYEGRGYESTPDISARLVAAIVPKPIQVTGWALALPEELRHEERDKGGAKSTHLAVPAGAVYYFEAEPDSNGGPGNAVALAAALNWHGATAGTEIKNRRSTLMGEKGFGLGVCGTWQFYEAAQA